VGKETWKAEWVDRLRSLLFVADRQYSYRDIADTMTKEFGIEFTRSAVIGKAYRIKRPDYDPQNYKPVKPAKPSSPRVHAAPSLVPLPIMACEVDAVTERMVRKDTCLWPMDGEVCNDSVVTGSYCEHHASLAYYRMPTVRRLRYYR
jgi:hypothetical protein